MTNPIPLPRAKIGDIVVVEGTELGEYYQCVVEEAWYSTVGNINNRWFFSAVDRLDEYFSCQDIVYNLTTGQSWNN